MLAVTYRAKPCNSFMGKDILHTEELLSPMRIPEAAINCSNNHTVNIARSQDFIVSLTSKSLFPVLKRLSVKSTFLFFFFNATFLGLQVDKHNLKWISNAGDK